LLDTALRFAEYKPRPFIAPLPIKGRVETFIMQDGVPLHYTVQNEVPGWWEIMPYKNHARVSDSASITKIMQYRELLPRFYSIACIPSGQNEWLVVPFNAADASQRGWRNGEPKQVYLVDETIEPFDVIITRSLAGLLLYDSLDYRQNVEMSGEMREIVNKKTDRFFTRDWANAFRIISDWMVKAEQEAKAKLIQDKLAKTQDRMKFMLEFMGAKLISSEKKGKGYKVTWEAPDGHTYKMGVREDGHISVAGFCLAGTDDQHNLSSIVQVMEEAHRQHRPDINQAYAEYDADDYLDNDEED